MARRSNKRKRADADTATGEKQKIAKLIESQASKERVRNHTSENTSTLRNEYSSLLTKFSPIPNVPLVETSTIVATVGDSVPQNGPDNEMSNGEAAEADESQDDNKISKRKLRMMKKPNLSELKKLTVYPEVVEWYDCDAQHPSLLVKIKSSKNVVPVPAHWQTKREYLSGRSLLEKKPFELPDIIKQTDIEVMRKTIPDDESGQEDPSLKQISRARVQPKLGSLDIDYKKLHDVFFKLGAHWKPDILLPYGDQYYENRNLHEEALWKKYREEKKPGRISNELREIMGLSEGQLPPWCSKMKAVGMPPSYPSLKIAGLNWGIENLTGEMYGVLNDATESSIQLFGTIIALEDEPETLENSVAMDKQEQEHPSEKAPEPFEAIGVDQKEDVKQIALNSLPAENSKVEEKSVTPKTLYTVLSQDTADQGLTYVIPGSANQHDRISKPEVAEQRKNDKDAKDSKFKF